MTDAYIDLHSALIDLECELRNLGLWQSERPSEAALSSTQPFCVDTLNFPQWLQFIFLERMLALVDARAPLPERCGIAPMAEEYFKPTAVNPEQLIGVLRRVDLLVITH